MHLFPRRLGQVTVASGVDHVAIGVDLPDQSTLKRVWLECELKLQDDVSVETTFPYTVAGFVLPHPDPDDGVSFDTLWDTWVPKDEDPAIGGVDMDTLAADTNALAEYGEANWESILGLGKKVPEIWRRDHIMTYANTNGMGFTTGTPPTYLPAMTYKASLSPNMRVDEPSVVVFGAGVPDFAETTTTDRVTLSEDGYYEIKYAEDTLKNAAIALIGRTEAGAADSPYEDAMNTIMAFMEDQILEKTAGWFDNGYTLNVMYKATFEIVVPGELNVGGSLGSRGW